MGRQIIKDYYDLYAHTFDKLDEMDQFCEIHNLPKLKRENPDNENRTIVFSQLGLTSLHKYSPCMSMKFAPEFTPLFPEGLQIALRL